MRYIVALLAPLLAAGCASTGENGDALAINNSPGAVNIGGPVTIVKQFGNCPEARSGFQTAQDGRAQQRGDVAFGAEDQGGSAAAEAGAALIASLAALDTCGPQERGDSEAPPPE